MRRASPSTIAVLPTPGSPMSTGLFFVRRDSTWMMRRISSSRPMTGSILPARAASVRSRPYFSSAWYCSSGLSLVTRCEPRTCLQRVEHRVVRDAHAAQQVADAAGHVGHREQHVLGREVLVVELGALLVGLLQQAERLGRELRVAHGRAAHLRLLLELVVDAAPQRVEVDADPFDHAGDDAFGLVEQRAQEVQRRDLGVARCRARRACAAPSASWVLRVNRLGSSAIFSSPSRRR